MERGLSADCVFDLKSMFSHPKGYEIKIKKGGKLPWQFVSMQKH